MKGLLTRTAATSLSVVLSLSAMVTPCAASTERGTATTPRIERRAATPPLLARLSPASRELLTGRRAAGQQPVADPGPTTPGSFFRSKRGAITLALMGAGAGFALWSIQHDRKPVKSPVR